LPRTRILIVEDNAADVRLVQEALIQKGIEAEIQHIETAYAATAAIKDITADSPLRPSLILLDYSLPGGTAGDILLAIRNNHALDGVPKAVLTCSVAPKDREDALRAGADLFVYKPADLDQFLNDVGSAVSSLLEGKSTVAGQ
jgi:CheY-like chemotaxis protein